MLDHSIARSLFKLNPIMSIIRRKAILETIAKEVVANACKPHKPLKRKSRAKTLLSPINVASLLSSSTYISFALSTTIIVAKSIMTPYTIY